MTRRWERTLIKSNIKILALVVTLTQLLASGCTGFKSFSAAGQPGETIALAMGWNQSLSKDELTVTITPEFGSPVVYLPGDPAIRALINMYPDPLSRLIIERETGTFADDGYLFSVLMENSVTGPDKDFSQKVLMMDLPDINVGSATISFSSTGGETLRSQTVEILPGGPVARNEFQIQEDLMPTLGEQLDLGERVPHYVVSFSGSPVPYAIQVDLSHDPAQSVGGVGKPYVVSPRGTDIKSTHWHDDGNNLRIILMPMGAPITDIVNFKFYVAGGVQNLHLTDPVLSVSAFDSSGTSIPDISAAINSYP